MTEFWSSPLVRTGLIPFIIAFVGIGFRLLAKQNDKAIELQDFWGLGVSLCVVALGINTAFFFGKVSEANKGGMALPSDVADQFWGLTVGLILLLVLMAVWQRFSPFRSAKLSIVVVILPAIMMGVGSNGLVLLAWG